MAFFNRRTGIAGLTVAALLCMICGIPFIAAFLGIGGVSLSVLLSDMPASLKIAIAIVGVLMLLSVIMFISKRPSKPDSGKHQ